MAKIGTLLISLEANVAQLQKDFEKAQKTMDGALGKMGAALKSFAGITTGYFTGRAIITFAQQTVDAANELADMSVRTGVAVESLAALRYGAEQSGAVMDNVARGLKNISEWSTLAAAGNEQMAAKFARFGVVVQGSNGALRPTEEILGDIADKLAAMPAGAARMEAAMRLVGVEAGPKLLPMLSNGRAGLQAFREEAEALGLVISSETAQSAADLNSAFSKLHGAGRGIANQIMEELSPALQTIADQMAGAAKGSSDFARVVTVSFKTVVSAGRVVWTVLSTISRTLGAMAGMAIELAQANLEGVRYYYNKASEENREQWDGMYRDIAETWGLIESTSTAGAKATGAAVTDHVVRPLSKAKDAAKELEKEIAAALAIGKEMDGLGDKLSALTEASTTAARQGMDALLQTRLMEAQATADKLDDIRRQLDIQIEGVNRQEEDEVLDPELAERQRVALRRQAARQMTEITRREAEEQAKAIQRSAASAASYFGGAFSDLLLMPLQEGFRGVANILEGLKNLLMDIIQRIASSAIVNLLMSAFGVPAAGGGGGFLSLLGFSSGGIVPGAPTPGRDSTVAALEPGEFVVRRAAVQRFGADFFERLNNLEMPRGLDAGSSTASNPAASVTYVDQRQIAAFDPRSMYEAAGVTLAPALYRRAANRSDPKLTSAQRRSLATPRMGRQAL